MARRPKSEGVSLNFDSFLDVITNCIGVLMVITILAIINTKYMTFIVRTPFVRHTDKTPVFFECRQNRNIPVDKMTIQTNMKGSMDSIKKNQSEYNRILQSYTPELRDVGDSYYQVDFTKLLREGILVLVPKADNQGETAEEIKTDESRFKKALQSIDPQKEFAFFLVRPDSYEVFREARDILWKKKIEVGWEPLAKDQFISFSTRGRKPTVD
jgi:hypothetical protein